MKRALILVVAAAILASAAATAKMPGGSFLNKAVNGTEQLTQQVTDDPIVAARYAKHFKISRDYVVAYFESNLAIGRLKSDYETTIYKIKGRTDIVAEHAVLSAGTYVFVSSSGEPMLEARTGNPVGTSLPVVSTKPGTGTPTLSAATGEGADPVVTKVLGTAPIETGVPVIAPMAGADGISPALIPGGVTLPAVEVVTSIPASSGGGISGATALLPLALLGAVVGGGGGGTSSVPPNPAAVPEPSSLILLAIGAGTVVQGIKRRR